jgi:phosphoribosylformylglycinamidine synthase subunit PurQ / glutaminase
VIWGVLQFPGSCDERDALHACGLAGTEAGGSARLVWHEETDLSGLDGIVIPGGFSYGDYLRAGAIARFAPAMAAVSEFARAGGPVLGICNGFQVLCESGLLPGALLTNESTRFICRPGRLVVGEADSPWLQDLAAGEQISIPFKHQSGRFFAPPEMLGEIEANRQVAFRYAAGENPNGSLNDIAGVVNREGNVLGLMPHPEHAVDLLTGSDDGLRIFRGPAHAAGSSRAAGVTGG